MTLYKSFEDWKKTHVEKSVDTILYETYEAGFDEALQLVIKELEEISKKNEGTS